MVGNISDKVLGELEKYASPSDAEFLQRFFKTGEGQYGAGDVFIGVRMPDTRRVAKQFRALPLSEIETLLASPIHEMRMCAVIIMAERAKRVDAAEHKRLLDLYLRSTDRINNWDIVDISCRDVVGGYILKHPEQARLLDNLASSKSLWERRIAMVSTWQLMRAGQLDVAYKIAEKLLCDNHDLIQKAVGWMLRTAGDKDTQRLSDFLVTNIAQIPRTTLRYAIEHFNLEERKHFLQLK